MKREIKLSEKYLSILSISYVKNCSTGEMHYEIRSKIVDIEEYNLNNDCIGEIEGEYFHEIKVYAPKILRARSENILERRIKKAISKIIERSKMLVIEWENRDIVMTNIASFLDSIE